MPRFVEDVDRDGEQQRTVRERRQDLEPVGAEGAVRRRDALGEPRGPSGLPAAGTGFRGEVILVNERVSVDSTRIDASSTELTVDAE